MSLLFSAITIYAIHNTSVTYPGGPYTDWHWGTQPTAPLAITNTPNPIDFGSQSRNTQPPAVTFRMGFSYSNYPRGCYISPSFTSVASGPFSIIYPPETNYPTTFDVKPTRASTNNLGVVNGSVKLFVTCGTNRWIGNDGAGNGIYENLSQAYVIPITMNVGNLACANCPTDPTVSPLVGTIDQAITFAFVSSDPQNDTVTYAVDWDRDGTDDEYTRILGSPPATLTHSWDSSGTKSFSVYAMDNALNRSRTVVVPITINLPPPNVKITPSPVDFGNVTIGSSFGRSIQVSVKNDCTRCASFDYGSSFPGGNFQVTNPGITPGTQMPYTPILAPGESVTWEVVIWNTDRPARQVSSSISLFPRDARLGTITIPLRMNLVNAAPTPTASLSATPNSITNASNQSSTLSWSSNASSCTASGGPGFTGTKGSSGTASVSPTVTTTYTITCGTASASATVTVTAPITNQGPLITGPTTGTPGQTLNFTARARDTASNQFVYYIVDWNKGASCTEWTPSEQQRVPLGNNVLAGSDQSFSHSWPTAGSYTFCVTDNNGSGNPYNWSEHAVTITSPTPLPPTLTDPAQAGDGQVRLDWTQSSGAIAYAVYRSTAGGTPTRLNDPASDRLASRTYTDTALTNGTAYTYYIKAGNTNGWSVKSNDVTGTPMALSSPAPSIPVISGPSSGIRNQAQTFTIQSFDSQGDRVKYEVVWDPDPVACNSGGFWETVPQESSSFVTSGIAQTISRSWATNGEKRFCVRTFDQSYNVSDWAVKQVSIGNPPAIDIGLKVKEAGGIISIAVEPQGTLTSPLRIAKGGQKYGVILVDPTDVKASKLRVRVNGIIKAARKL